MADTQQSYRMDRSVLTITTLSEAPDDTQFWLTKSVAERFAALEFMRQTMYGYNSTTDRLQRVLTITQRPTG